MKRVEQLLRNSDYILLVNYLKEKEAERTFCKHDLAHFIDVARIAYIKCLEQQLGISKEVVYYTALLHDLGRALENKEDYSAIKSWKGKIGEQLEPQESHEKVSWKIAKVFLAESTFTEQEVSWIKEAILGHRSEKQTGWAKIFYEADKLSRRCFDCTASHECYWNSERKNSSLFV